MNVVLSAEYHSITDLIPHSSDDVTVKWIIPCCTPDGASIVGVFGIKALRFILYGV